MSAKEMLFKGLFAFVSVVAATCLIALGYFLLLIAHHTAHQWGLAG